MPSPLFDIYDGQRNPMMQLHQQVEAFKKQFAANADPRQIIQQALQEGKVSQQQYNAAYAQLQQMRGR